jgi:hypothetical protein
MSSLFNPRLWSRLYELVLILPSSGLDMLRKAMVSDCEEFESKVALMTKAGQVMYT